MKQKPKVVANPFVYEDAARRYARARPNYQDQVVARARAVLRRHGSRIGLALDVGCGTGASSIAFAELARRVVAVDSSRAMLALAPRHERIAYVRSPAEKLPAEDEAADLVVAGLAFHWFDQPRFLAEAHRVLKPQGWLLIYSDLCTYKMVRSKALNGWAEDRYLKKFPSPPFHGRRVMPRHMKQYGFRAAGTKRFDYTVKFGAADFVDYLTTQSNVVVAVGSSRRRLSAARSWLQRELQDKFDGRNRRIKFKCTIQFLRSATK